MRAFRWPILLLLLSASFGASSQDVPEPPILSILASAPDTPDTRQLLTYADYQAMTGGSTTEQDWVDSLSRNLYGGPDMSMFFSRASDQEALIGVPLFDVAQAAMWGQPPEQTILLQGAIDADAVVAAYAARDFSAEPIGDLTMYCGPDGCDSGHTSHLATSNTGDPFGGELGAQWPVLFVPTDGQSQLVGSPDLPKLEADASAVTGKLPSLADSPDYQAAVHALTDSSTLLQAVFLSPEVFGPSSDASEIPVYSLAVLAETETDDGLGASITLIFPSLADAEAALPALEERMTTLTPGRSNQSFAATLKDRGVLYTTHTFEDSESGLGVAQFVFQSPEEERSAFALLVNSLSRRDLDWLAPS